MSTSASLTRLMLWPNSVDQQFGGVLVDRLGDGDRHAHLEQRLDQVGAALGHAVGELLDGDRLGNDDVADLLGRRAGLLMGALFLLAGAAQRGEAAGAAVVLARKGAGDGELAGVAAVVAAAAPGGPGSGRLGGVGRWAGHGRRGRSSSSASAAGAAASAARRGFLGGARASASAACVGAASARSSSALRFSSARRFSSSVALAPA